MKQIALIFLFILICSLIYAVLSIKNLKFAKIIFFVSVLIFILYIPFLNLLHTNNIANLDFYFSNKIIAYLIFALVLSILLLVVSVVYAFLSTISITVSTIKKIINFFKNLLSNIDLKKTKKKTTYFEKTKIFDNKIYLVFCKLLN